MLKEEDRREIFIQKRARALTMMLVTRQEDLLIEEAQDDMGLDYIVRLPTESKESRRELGIEIRGVSRAVSKEDADMILHPFVEKKNLYDPFQGPVCLFLFTMQNDGGWYAWLREPVESDDGRPILRFCDEPECQQLDKKAFKAILEQVDSWYDVLSDKSIVNGPAANKTDRKRAKH